MLFDPIRRKSIEARPEERVRQQLLLHMIEKLSFPKQLILVEKEIKELVHIATSEPIPKRKIDIFVYVPHKDKMLPLLMIECKKEKKDKGALEQVLGYNHYVKAFFVGIADNDSFSLFWKENDVYKNIDFLPSYKELKEAALGCL